MYVPCAGGQVRRQGIHQGLPWRADPLGQVMQSIMTQHLQKLARSQGQPSCILVMS